MSDALRGQDRSAPGLSGDDSGGDGGLAASSMLERLLMTRSSCRAFRREAVPDDRIRHLFALAQRTPSWCNSQPWQVIVTSGEGTERFRTALYDAASRLPMRSDVPPPAEYSGVYLARRREAGYGLYGALGIPRDARAARDRQQMENFRFFGAPHVAVITSEAALGAYGLVDCGGYVSTLLVAAHSLGIAAVPQAAIAMYSDVVREHFGIGDDRVILCGVSFGYAQADHPANLFRTSRERISAVAQLIND